jgi:hypothetical protein
MDGPSLFRSVTAPFLVQPSRASSSLTRTRCAPVAPSAASQTLALTAVFPPSCIARETQVSPAAAALAPPLPSTFTARAASRGPSSSAPISPPSGGRPAQRPTNVRWPSGEVVRKVRGDEDDSAEEAAGSEGGAADDWVDDLASPPGGSTPTFAPSAHRRLPSAGSAISASTAGSSTLGGGGGSIAPSSRASSIYSTTSSKKSKSARWLTSSASGPSSSKRSSVKLGSSPPASSTPLSHSVLRSLPLGSMGEPLTPAKATFFVLPMLNGVRSSTVPLGDQKKMSSSKARKLDAEAASAHPSVSG